MPGSLRGEHYRMNWSWHWPSIFFYSMVVALVTFCGAIAQKRRTTVSITEKINYYSTNRHVLIFAFGIMWLVSACRYNVGADFQTYIEIYDYFKTASLQNFIWLVSIEPGYAILNIISKYIYDDPQTVFALSSLISLAFIYAGIKHNRSKINISLAIFFFMVIFYFDFFTIVRMGIALSIVFYGYRYICERKLFKFSLFILLAFCFHYTALVVWPFYFFCGKGKIHLKLIYIISGVLLYLGIDYIVKNLVGTKFEIYLSAISQEFGLGNLIIRLPLLILVMLFYKKLINVNNDNQVYIDMLIAELIISQFAYKLLILERLTKYFSLSKIYLLPTFTKALKKEDAYIILPVILVWELTKFYLFSFSAEKGILPYTTFFNWTP